MALRRALAVSGRETPPAGRCPEAEQLVGLALGAMAIERDRRRLLIHLDRCRACARDLDAIERAAANLAGPPPAPLPAPLPAGGARKAAATVCRDLVEALRGLVAFDLPPRLQLAPRAAAAGAPGTDYDRGMAAYGRGRYPAALVALERARAAGERAADLGFYLGLCLLAAGRAAEAVAALRDAVRRNAGLGEYRYYLAQALLAEGSGREALRQLERAGRLPGPWREPSRRLAERLRDLMAIG